MTNVLGHGMDSQGFESRQDKRLLSSPKVPIGFLEYTTTNSMGTRAISLRVKSKGREDDHSNLLPKCRMIWVILQLLLYAFKVCVGTAWSYNPLIQMNRVIYGEARGGLTG